MTKKKINNNNYLVPLEDLLAAGCHFGHQKKRWHPKMAPYIWQEKEGIHIFDLAKTSQLLNQACLAIRDLAQKGKKIILVGTKRQAQSVIKEIATQKGIPYVNNRWLGGTITNWKQIKKSIDKLKELRERKEKGEFKKYTKKENLLIERKISRLSRFFEGLLNLDDKPDAIFVIDVKREIVAIKEARAKNIPVFAIVDSNVNPDLVNYPIPANDDSIRSIKIIVEKISQAIKDGQEVAKNFKKND